MTSTTPPDLAGLVDLDALGAWMVEQGLPDGGFSDVTRLTGGTQNLLVRFVRGGEAFVLRRPPQHLRAKSNENLLREARMLGALTGRGVAAPAWIATCADPSVIGGVFFLMEAVAGFNPSNGLPQLHASDPSVRRGMGLSAVSALAQLGAVDHVAIGLSDFGRPDGFLERQVPRWLGELESYSALEGYGESRLPRVREIASWLESRIPTTFRAGIMHGDFHLGNLLFSYDGPELTSIVDWEMCTIGDPLLDLGWLLATWPDGAEDPISVLASSFAAAGGLATRSELVERYAAGSDRDLSAITWYGVLACFKLAIVLEGTYARALAGKADAGIGDLLHGVAVSLFERAQLFIDEGV